MFQRVKRTQLKDTRRNSFGSDKNGNIAFEKRLGGDEQSISRILKKVEMAALQVSVSWRGAK